MTTTQPTITLSLADARKLATGELREVRVRMKRQPLANEVVVPCDREWGFCRPGNTKAIRLWIRAPYQPDDVLAVKEPFALHANGNRYCLAYAADGQCVGIGGDGCENWIHVDHGWCMGLATHRRDGRWVGRTMYGRVRAAREMRSPAVRHWLRVTACEPVQEGAKWWWRVAVENVEQP